MPHENRAGYSHGVREPTSAFTADISTCPDIRSHRRIRELTATVTRRIALVHRRNVDHSSADMKTITLAGLAVIAWTTAVAAQPDADTGAYWTPDRIRNAKPLDLTTANVRLTPAGPIGTMGLRAQTSPEVGTATPPDADVQPNLRRELFPTSPDAWSDDNVPAAVAPRSTGEPVAAGDVGEAEALYTSSRLVPTTSANS